MSVVRDVVGERGERIVYLRLTDFIPPGEPMFRPHFLGEKYPTLDFLVELVGATGSLVPYFFVQAKATTQGFTKRPRNLRIQVSEEDVRRLVAYPAPTYIIGIDAAREEGFIIAAITGGPRRVSSLSTRHPLNQATLQLLYDEVLLFWQTNGASFSSSGLA